MKQTIILLILVLSFSASAQMDNTKLEALISQQVDSIIGTPGRWQVTYRELPMMIITDETNDRMRIIAPIVDVDKLDKEVLLDCLVANYHTALDVKYAVSNDIMWSVFIHPLSSLTEGELKSAIEQVYLAAINFGGSYTSTQLLFGGGNTEGKQESKPKLKKT
ncbi:MAG: hypothetical protein O6943_10400 [Bacteroidetes bacterium]|nr:hypothetical protein [Bacteroidota bacterium]